MAALAPRSGGRLHVVSTFYPDANLYEPPPPYTGHGRPRVKGVKLPSPREVVAQAWRARAAGARGQWAVPSRASWGCTAWWRCATGRCRLRTKTRGAVDWEGKQTVTFSDALSAVRRWLWTHWVFPRAGHAEAFAKLPQEFQQLLLSALAPAA